MAESRSMNLTTAECGVVWLLVLVFSLYGKCTGRWPTRRTGGWRGIIPRAGFWRCVAGSLLAKLLVGLMVAACPLALFGQRLCWERQKGRCR